jgi:RNA polymerase sigma-B factor
MENPPPERDEGEVGSGTAKLLRAYHEAGDITARERLVELYLPLVEGLARRYAGSSDIYDDLYQVGCIGLINAIDRFELDRGGELAAFAVPNVAGEIRRYLRDRGTSVRLPRPVLELKGPALRAQRELAAKLGREPTSAEVAREVGADDQDVALALTATGASLQFELSPEAGDEQSQGGQSLDAAEDRVFLSDAFRGLDDRERRILYLRYVRDLEPNQIARELGISRRQLSRNTQAALAKLRLGLERTRGPEDAPSGQPPKKRLPRPAGRPKMATMASSRTLDEASYFEQPYHIGLVKDDAAGGWTAQVEELPGCEAHGRTADEAARRIEGAMHDWIADALANRREVPKPRSASSHSGRLLLRMPQSLHAELARAAEREEVSLNQFITSSLASTIRWRRGDEPQGRSEAPSDEATEADVEPARRGFRFVVVAYLVVLAVMAIVALALLVIAVRQGL